MLGGPSRQTHLFAALLFTGLTIFSSLLSHKSASGNWKTFSTLTLLAAALAWYYYLRSRQNDIRDQQDQGNPDNLPSFPEGQARLIDSGRLPNRHNPEIKLKDLEVCHFSVPALRVLFKPLPESMNADPSRLLIRYSGGSFYYIVRPQEILLPAEPDDLINGELAITNQRIIFLCSENGFEVPLNSLKLLDCSAHLVDFQVRDRRFTIQTEAAGYAEKVLLLLLQPPEAT